MSLPPPYFEWRGHKKAYILILNIFILYVQLKRKWFAALKKIKLENLKNMNDK